MQWDWVSWLIPLVALFVWILSNLARVREDEPRRARPPQARSDADPDAPPRKSSDADQFLEEARQRREQREARKKAEETRRVQPVREEPRRSVVSAQPARVEPVRKPAPPPLPKVVVKPASQSRQPGPRVEEVVVAKIVAPSRAEEAPGAPAPSFERSARKQILEMLKKKENLKAAFLLREILDPPLCRRKLPKNETC